MRGWRPSCSASGICTPKRNARCLSATSMGSRSIKSRTIAATCLASPRAPLFRESSGRRANAASESLVAPSVDVFASVGPSVLAEHAAIRRTTPACPPIRGVAIRTGAAPRDRAFRQWYSGSVQGQETFATNICNRRARGGASDNADGVPRLSGSCLSHRGRNSFHPRYAR